MAAQMPCGRSSSRFAATSKTPIPAAPTVPASRSLKLRLLLWLYSNGNILGCLLALIGPALLFAGTIGTGWGWITAGLYAIGAVAGWASSSQPDIQRAIAADLGREAILEQLDALLQRVRPHLSADMNQHLQQLRQSIADILPRLGHGSLHDADLYTVRETVLRYLPETLANYLALPPVFRHTHILKDGKTARQILAEQLTLLDDKMQEITTNLSQSDAQALLANGQFLREQFQQADFWLK